MSSDLFFFYINEARFLSPPPDPVAVGKCTRCGNDIYLPEPDVPQTGIPHLCSRCRREGCKIGTREAQTYET